MQLGLVEDSVKHLSHVRFVKRCTGTGRENPVGSRESELQPLRVLLTPPEAQYRSQLRRKVYLSALVILRGR